MNSVVFIKKIAQDSEALKKQFRHSFISISLIDDFRKAKAIFIKPNLTYPNYKKGVQQKFT